MKKIIVIIVSIILIVSAIYWWNEKQSEESLANDSCVSVNHILSEQFQMDNVRCEKVVIERKVSGDFYQAKVYLSTGKVSDIGIKDKGDKVLVTMSRD